MRAWEIMAGVAAGALVAWLALVGVLLVGKPRGGALPEALRLLPDLLRLVGRLAADGTLPSGVRGRLLLLGGYLAMPFDLIPDFVPVLGYADDAIVVAWTLRSVARRVGLPALRRHWPGSDDGFAALCRLLRLPTDGSPLLPAKRSWWVDGALLAGFIALTLALTNEAVLAIDVRVDDWCRAHRPELLYWLARGGNLLGQGTPLAVLALGLAVVLGWRRRSVRPLLPVLAAELLTGVTVLALKLGLHRAPPNNQNGVANPERLFSDPAGQSYPSGHLVVAIVWYGIIALLLAGILREQRRWALRVVPPVILFFTTVYLSFHWLTDSVAGLLLGLLLYRLLMRAPWDSLPLGRRLATSGWARPGLARQR
ncbi:phosphatase PAP2 family protein [Planosporangium flavigriseum]|uniref:phosphatase PAP2 family protein n=1 Tax=Planosporangium flavigriseum TaxID=373681 RepID=UPI001EF34462|nr:phosphatase PAP2 family protein [Planosporangium flavigriseum]